MSETLRRQCDMCGKNVKLRGYHVHLRLAHGVKREDLPQHLNPPEESQEEPVRFMSTRAPEMVVVVRPDEWQNIDGPGGSRMRLMKGKRIEFHRGEYITADPDEIDYLENVYEDRRYPVLSMRKVREAS